ncbi:MAG TPA: hypothetical protein VHZ73_00545 [Vicinamibacterales bacterium]|jgi:hypothetical protein|nr:hypothetical protein [Vicinamibacterales bacterium]
MSTPKHPGLWQPPAGTPIFITDRDDAPQHVEASYADETETPTGMMPHGFIEWFVVAQTAIPALLFIPGSQAFRLPIRIGAYAITLVAFAVWWFGRGGKRTTRHPAERWLLLVLLNLTVMIFHPQTPGLLAGLGQTVLYFSIFCSVFWASAFVTKPAQLTRILALLLVCNGINAGVGVMQVYDPDRWMPRELSFAYQRGSQALAAAMFLGPNGRILVRPPGLFDTPGAVCGPGTVAAILGLIFALEPIAWWKRLAALGFSFLGISAIYLSHVRANFVILLGMMVAYGLMLGLSNRKTKATVFAGLCAGLVVVGFTASVIIGGDGIRDRFLTLLADDPRAVYAQNRGSGMAEGMSELLDDYPFGAGLARWGMMRTYFGSAATLDSTELFAEVQPNAWMLDGGVTLVGLYGIALLVTAFYEWRIVKSVRDPDQMPWIAAVVAANLGTMAMVFSFVPFGTQMGLQFWFLEGVLHGVVVGHLNKT